MGKGQRERENRKVENTERQKAIQQAQSEITRTVNAVGLLTARTNDLISGVIEALLAKGILTKEEIHVQLKKIDAVRNQDIADEAKRRNEKQQGFESEKQEDRISENHSDDKHK